jgi:hypothetical protein
MNWALNVAPLLRPGIAALYDKMAGKNNPNQLVFVNRSVRRDLTWFHDHFNALTARRLFDDEIWGENDADITIYCDASLSGYAFVCPDLRKGFFSTDVTSKGDLGIFWLESFAVLAALQWTIAAHGGSRRILVYTDNENANHMFSSLKARGRYNALLCTTVDLFIAHQCRLRTQWIPTYSNTVADALSRGAAYQGSLSTSLRLPCIGRRR